MIQTINESVPLKLDQLAVKLPQKSITDYDWRIQTKRDAKVYNGNVVIGQAYNKGNLVVLSSKEQSDRRIQAKGDNMTFELFYYSFVAMVIFMGYLVYEDHRNGQ